MTRLQRAVYTILLLLSTASLGAFGWWWFRTAHIPNNFTGGRHAVDVGLFVALTLVFTHRLFMDVLSWVIAWGIRPMRAVLPPLPGMRVAFITTYVPGCESIDLLERTLPAMLEADYPHDVWLLDEGDDPWARQLCARLGVHHFSRKGIDRYNTPDGIFAAKTKGGNHNAWYDAVGHGYDVVAQIDTDFLPRKDFLTKTLGHFRDPKVGWVGTPQVYGNIKESGVARGAAQQLYMFYGALLRGLGGRDTCLMIGANHIVRVQALEDLGWYVGHLTEDLITGLKLHSNGWKSRYVHEPLAIGEGPTTWTALFNQQDRWAFGCMDILRRDTLRLSRRLSRRQAGLYIALQQHYFSGVASMLGVILLGAYFFGGLYPANVGVVEMVEWTAPLYLMRQVMVLWLQRFSPPGQHEKGLLLRGRFSATVLWPVYFLAFIGVVRGKRLTFKVTPKGGVSQPNTIAPRLVLPHALVGLLTIGFLTTGVIEHREAVALMFWAALNSLVMLTFSVWAVADGRVFNRLPQPVTARHRRTRVAKVIVLPPNVIDLTSPSPVAVG